MSRAARLRLQPSRAVVRRAAGHRPAAPKVIRIAPRSAVASADTAAPAGGIAPAGHLAVIDETPVEEPRELGPLRAIRRRLAALAAAALVVAVVALAAGGTRVVLAVFTDQAVVDATFTTGTWGGTTWYLHDNPTPPTADTTSRAVLDMDATAPVAATLVNYDTDCDDRPGRSIDRGSGAATEATACRFAAWRSTPLAAARTFDGAASLVVYTRKQASGGPNPTLRAHLRWFDPATGAHVEIGTAWAAINTNPKQAWSQRTFTWTLAGVTIPESAQVEVKIVASGGTPDLEIAYDTTGQPSSLTLP